MREEVSGALSVSSEVVCWRRPLRALVVGAEAVVGVEDCRCC